MAACPDDQYRNGKQAVVAARHACEIAGWDDPRMLATLAAAYAEAGDFESSVKYGEQALAGAAENKKALTAKRLETYRAGKPWREQPAP